MIPPSSPAPRIWSMAASRSRGLRERNQRRAIDREVARQAVTDP
jgi:hypothetical protein